MLNTITKGTQSAPPRFLIYGTEGIGKSTFAARAPSPIFIQTEDGLGEINCLKFPLAKTFGDVTGALESLNDKHDFQTVVIDSLDWLESLIHAQVCTDFGPIKYDSIEKVDGGYGKGYIHALTLWRKVVDALTTLREKKSMAVILLAHSKIEKYEAPGESVVDRYSPRLHKHAAALITEWCDAALFATWKYTAAKQDSNSRILRCIGSQKCVAKNRYSLPAELPLDWPTLMSAMTAKKGSVNNG